MSNRHEKTLMLIKIKMDLPVRAGVKTWAELVNRDRIVTCPGQRWRTTQIGCERILRL